MTWLAEESESESRAFLGNQIGKDLFATSFRKISNLFSCSTDITGKWFLTGFKSWNKHKTNQTYFKSKWHKTSQRIMAVSLFWASASCFLSSSILCSFSFTSCSLLVVILSWGLSSSSLPVATCAGSCSTPSSAVATSASFSGKPPKSSSMGSTLHGVSGISITSGAVAGLGDSAATIAAGGGVMGSSGSWESCAVSSSSSELSDSPPHSSSSSPSSSSSSCSASCVSSSSSSYGVRTWTNWPEKCLGISNTWRYDDAQLYYRPEDAEGSYVAQSV